MNYSCRHILLLGLAISGLLIGCQQQVTVIETKLVQRDRPTVIPTIIGRQSDPIIRRHLSHGLTELAAGDTSKAVDQFNRALRLDTTAWSPHVMLGFARAQSSPQQSITHFHTALRLAPDDDTVRSLIYIGMAVCYENQDSFGRARQSYQTALRILPDSDHARRGLRRLDEAAESGH